VLRHSNGHTFMCYRPFTISSCRRMHLSSTAHYWLSKSFNCDHMRTSNTANFNFKWNIPVLTGMIFEITVF
jgi:hypothetical protein